MCHLIVFLKQETYIYNSTNSYSIKISNYIIHYIVSNIYSAIMHTNNIFNVMDTIRTLWFAAELKESYLLQKPCREFFVPFQLHKKRFLFVSYINCSTTVYSPYRFIAFAQVKFYCYTKECCRYRTVSGNDSSLTLKTYFVRTLCLVL